eukprot:scaffold4412_cov91-Cylindrotheca_fusiformis.AAC.1
MKSSWIWMKGANDDTDTDTDPINEKVAMDPIGPEDDRPSVSELIKEHADKINQVRIELKETMEPLYDPSKHDDLWILRFLLSHKLKTKRAIKAAKHTLDFRKEYHLDEQDIRHYPPHKVRDNDVTLENPKFQSFGRAFGLRAPEDAIIYTIPNQQRGVLAFLKYTGMKSDSETLNQLSDEEWDSMFVYTSEWSFQWLDYVTRTTGRLTKTVRFVNLEGVSYSDFHRKAIQRDGKILDRMEDVYPQLLHALYIYNAPSWINTVWGLVRP